MSIVEGVDIGDSYAVIENGKVINVIRCKSDWVPPSGQTKVNIDSLPEVGLNDSYDGSNFTTDPARIGTSDSAAWLRLERNARLTQSDWTQSRDITLSNDSEWLTYRQSLRDLPANTADLDNPTWPTKPS